MPTSPTHPNHEITALIRVDPAEARKRVLAALRKTGTHKGRAAAALGCTHGTLLRWIDQLGLPDAVERLEEEALRKGFHHGRRGGRPPGSTVANGAARRGARARLAG